MMGPSFHPRECSTRRIKNRPAGKSPNLRQTEMPRKGSSFLYWHLQEIISDEQPYTFLFANKLAAA